MPSTFTRYPLWLPRASRTVRMRSPSSPRLYTKNVCVDVGTVLNTVSRFTVSVEKVSLADELVVNESSSVHAAMANATVTAKKT